MIPIVMLCDLFIQDDDTCIAKLYRDKKHFLGNIDNLSVLPRDFQLPNLPHNIYMHKNHGKPRNKILSTYLSTKFKLKSKYF